MIGHPPISTLSPGATLFRSNDADSAVQALNVGDKLTDCFTVTTIDGTPQVVTITINGANDTAVIYDATTGSRTSAATYPAKTPAASSTLSETAVGNTATTFTAVSAQTIEPCARTYPS